MNKLKPIGGVDEDLIFLDKKGNVVEVYPCGSDEQKRYQKMIEICHEMDKKALQKVIRYNISDVARVLKIPRQTIYYWIKKGWVKPRRDSRNYLVFTVFDIEVILKWRNKLNLDNFTKKIEKNRK